MQQININCARYCLLSPAANVTTLATDVHVFINVRRFSCKAQVIFCSILTKL